MDALTLDPQTQEKANEFIRQHVTAGFAAADQIIEWALDYFADPSDFDALEAYVVQATRAAIAAHCAAQRAWPAETDCDRLDFAFLLLEEEHGIVARQNFTCCQSDGHSEIWGEIRAAQKARPVSGYIFYHERDTESVVETGKLYLAFGAVEKGETAQLAVAQRSVAVLREAGFTVEWNGSTNQRPCLTGLDWKKRREECR